MRCLLWVQNLICLPLLLTFCKQYCIGPCCEGSLYNFYKTKITLLMITKQTAMRQYCIALCYYVTQLCYFVAKRSKSLLLMNSTKPMVIDNSMCLHKPVYIIGVQWIEFPKNVCFIGHIYLYALADLFHYYIMISVFDMSLKFAIQDYSLSTQSQWVKFHIMLSNISEKKKITYIAPSFIDQDILIRNLFLSHFFKPTAMIAYIDSSPN